MAVLVKIIAWLFSRISARAAAVIGRGIGRFLWLILPSKRRQAAAAMKTANPDWDDARIGALTRGVFRTQGCLFAEVMRLFGRASDDPVNMIEAAPETAEVLNRFRDERKGIIVLTGHMNNYELLLSWTGRHYGATVITKKLKPESLDRLLCATRERNGVNILPRRGSYRDALRAIKQGGLLGFILDQNMRYEFGIFTTFFGRPACTSPGLAMMSAQAGVPVLPACIYRVGDRYIFKSLPLIDPPPGRSREEIHRATQQYTNAIEAMVREQPEGWIWMHRRWRTQPRKGDPITRPDGTIYHA